MSRQSAPSLQVPGYTSLKDLLTHSSGQIPLLAASGAPHPPPEPAQL